MHRHRSKCVSTLVLQLVLSLVVYSALSIAVTYPLCIDIASNLWSGQWDTLSLNWGSEHVTRLSLPSIVYPFGHVVSAISVQPALKFLLESGSAVLGGIANWNLIVLLGFPVSAAAAFGVFRWLGVAFLPALLGGFVFGFTPGAFMQSLGGHAYFLNFAIPLLFFALVLNKRKRSIPRAVFVGIAYSLVALLLSYWGYFVLFFLVLFLLFDLKTRETDLWEIVLNYSVAGISALIIIVAFVWPIVFEQLTLPTGELVATGRKRPIEELFMYSARIEQFLIPPVTHPVFGPLADAYWLKHPLLSNIPESTLYLGFVPVAVLGVTVFLLYRKYIAGRARVLCLLFLSGFALMIVLSLPPYLELAGTRIPLLGYFLHKVAPMFRVYQRTVILSSFFLAGVVVVFFDHLYRKMNKPGFYTLFFAVSALIGFEYWHDSSNLLYDTRKVPAVYSWLKTDSASKVIAEYPMVISDGCSSYAYLFFQRVHEKTLVNGAPRGTPAWVFFEEVRRLDEPRTVGRLKEAGVDYLVVHASGYRKGDLAPGTPYGMPLSLRTKPDYELEPVPPIPYGLSLVKDFGRDKVFAPKK